MPDKPSRYERPRASNRRQPSLRTMTLSPSRSARSSQRALWIQTCASACPSTAAAARGCCASSLIAPPLLPPNPCAPPARGSMPVEIGQAALGHRLDALGEVLAAAQPILLDQLALADRRGHIDYRMQAIAGIAPARAESRGGSDRLSSSEPTTCTNRWG